MKRSMALGIIAIMAVSMGLGCLKVESEITVHANGSATGSVTMGIMEEYWNLSGGNMSFGNFTLIDAENATVWTEDGWIYFREEDLFVPEENMSIEIIPRNGYNEYVIDANLSGVQEDVSEDDEFNLSDPFTQLFLEQMTFEFAIVMPGEIIESNAHEVVGARANWFYDGTTMESAERLYVRSKDIPEICWLISLVAISGIGAARKRLRAG